MFKLYCHLSNTTEVLLMLIGAIGGLASGVAGPLMSFLFGDSLGDFSDFQNGEVNKNDDDEKKKKLKERKGDWTCAKCGNLNFSFRIICNRCQLPKKDSDIINTPMSLQFNDNMMCHYSMNFVNNGEIYCNNMNVLNQNRGNNIGGELSENVNE